MTKIEIWRMEGREKARTQEAGAKHGACKLPAQHRGGKQSKEKLTNTGRRRVRAEECAGAALANGAYIPPHTLAAQEAPDMGDIGYQQRVLGCND